MFNHSIPLLSYPMNDAAETVNEIGATVRRVMGGTTGILYDHSWIWFLLQLEKSSITILVLYRYDILCKAAYASLKGTKTVEAKHCKQDLIYLFSSIYHISHTRGCFTSRGSCFTIIYRCHKQIWWCSWRLSNHAWCSDSCFKNSERGGQLLSSNFICWQ